MLPRLPARRDQRLGIGGVRGQVDRARSVVNLKHVRPGAAAVNGAEHAALRMRPEKMADCSHQHNVGIARVYPDASDIAGVRKAQRAPGLAAIVRAEHTGARRDVIARLGLAGADVDRVGIGRGDGNGAYGRGGPLIEQRHPALACIVAAPYAAARGTENKGIGARSGTCHHLAPTGSERPEQPPAQVAKQVRAVLRCGCGSTGRFTGDCARHCGKYCGSGCHGQDPQPGVESWH